jgi:hypothetical protein
LTEGGPYLIAIIRRRPTGLTAKSPDGSQRKLRLPDYPLCRISRALRAIRPEGQPQCTPKQPRAKSGVCDLVDVFTPVALQIKEFP